MIADSKPEELEDIDPYPFRLRRETINSVRPPRDIRSWDLVSKDIRSHKDEPFSENDYPWTEGICDAFDDPDIRVVALQFAARIGKTLLSQALMIAANIRSPATSMFASSTEQLVKETIRNKYFPMFGKCRHTRRWLPPKARQLQTRMDMSQFTMYTAWSGSFSTLADKDPRYKHAGEIDKWDTSASTEADPLELFLERGIEIPDRKTIVESTPGIEGKSRINSWLMMGTNCRWHCPCPHKSCGHYQELTLGDGSGGGIHFKKRSDGSLDADLAYTTAQYRCEKCSRVIKEEHRRSVIRKGKWVAEGQYVTKSGSIRGKKVRDGEVASFQLSRIYAPTFSFGDVARQFVRAKLAEKSGNDDPIRNFENSWMGRTWTPRKLITTWEVLGPRLSTSCQGFDEYHIGEIPEGCNFATMGVDVQADHYVYTNIAWRHDQAGFLYDYGICQTEGDLLDQVLRRTSMPRGDDIVELAPTLTLMDARDGNRQDEVIELCRKLNSPAVNRYVWPSMGTRTSLMRGKTFTRNEVDGAHGLRAKRKQKKSSGFYWISVNANYWQQWVQNCLVRRNPGEPYSLAFPLEAREDQDFLEQMLNEQAEQKPDSTGHDDTTKWVVVNQSIPWDFRDAVRYARCAAEVSTNGNWQRVVPNSVFNTSLPKTTTKTAAKKKTPAPAAAKKKKKGDWLTKAARRKFLRS